MIEISLSLSDLCQLRMGFNHQPFRQLWSSSQRNSRSSPRASATKDWQM